MVWLSYFDKPDDEDCFGKIAYTTKKCGVIGAFIGGLDAAAISRPETVYAGLQKVVFWVTPFVAMGATSAAVACALANLRKTDDDFNFFAGGFAGGSVWGIKYRNRVLGLGIGILCGLFCWTVKVAHRENWDQFPVILPTPRSYGIGVNHYKRDFTLRMDPKNYPKPVYDDEDSGK